MGLEVPNPQFAASVREFEGRCSIRCMAALGESIQFADMATATNDPVFASKQGKLDNEDVEEEEHPAVSRFRRFLRIKTVQPAPDYGLCMLIQ